MFTVKATYRGEIRKFSFNDLTFFPSFDQLQNQLYRVFPSSHSYFLSKLLFSPDASQPSRILISQEVHSPDDYAKCLQPYYGRSWSNALLRVSVFDETPHKIPNIKLNAMSQGVSDIVTANSSSIDAGPIRHTPPISLFHIPPPPIIFSSVPRVASQPPMDFNTQPFNTSSSTQYMFPTASPQLNTFTAKTSECCCSVAQCKADTQSLLSNFQRDLDHILVKTFGSSSYTAGDIHMKTPVEANRTNIGLSQSPLCSYCANALIGHWYTCQNCYVSLCFRCHIDGVSNVCTFASGPHVMKIAAPDSSSSITPPFSSWPGPPRWPPNYNPIQNYPPFTVVPPQTSYNYSGYSYPTITPTTPRIPFIPPSPVASPQIPASESVNTRPASPPLMPPPPPPIIHEGVICDMCEAVIEGIRHKCLDCPDYDLCTACISSGSAERHNPFHEFFDIKEPGRVIVHTIFNGEAPSDSNPNSTRSHAAESEPVNAVHNATCDLCDSRIQGNRYKCVMCPDFDACDSCFSITNEQHPGHSFVKLSTPDNYIQRNILPAPQHFAACDACNKPISGIRYKCMHPQCPDFDLCEGCEAHPIPVHPDTHPMLKIKSIEIPIPKLLRSDEIHELVNCDPPEVSHRGRTSGYAVSRSPSFERGYMHNPSEQLERSKSSSPINGAPSPFFFGANISRPISPTLEITHDLPRCQSPLDDSYCPSFTQVEPINPFIPRYGPVSPVTIFQNPAPLSIPINDISRRSPSPARRSPRPLSLSRSRSSSPIWKCAPLTTSRSGSPNCWPPPVDYSHLSRNILSSVPPSSRPGNIDDSTTGQLPTAGFVCETPVSDAPTPLVADHSPSPISPAMFPRTWLSSEELKHLLQEAPKPVLHKSGSENTPGTTTNATHSPLNNEALLKRPVIYSDNSQGDLMSIASTNRSLAALLDGYHLPSTLRPSHTMPTTTDDKEVTPKEVAPEEQEPLTAGFIADITVPDGQIFPPGAEFMKCWRMINDSKRDWPESTELVFVAGVPLARESSPQSVVVGHVKAGTEVDLWTGELKAPDFPGRYVSYWRLRDDKGQLFGNSIWIDINVVEATHHLSDESMTSSVVIMPTVASSRSRTSLPESNAHIARTLTTADSPVISSKDPVDDILSDEDLSDNSSVSLISVPSSDEIDDAVWEDSRSQVTVEQVTQAMEYVLLYDDNTSEED